MNRYIVKKIDLRNVKNADDYFKEVQNAPVTICDGMKEVQNYCGGKLHRQRNGYSGVNGNTEYLAEKV